ncbi:hypothetical protein MB818_06450 [Ruegeria sp. 1NDH52C]|uniref:DUF4399 domain-containing protein n=1 Tax=Ruegeria alba TaxID=2916756 RepID=A0ABS9NUD1_9RHOB|nr:hypothetical protein [Ruegeria alba]MCE8521503.1 hypothetical protein [Ruegeria pomeroyi]MCG6557831.1 hypothetical protein [Ruegeria alba]
MSRSLALFAIGLVFGGGAGFVTAAAYGVTFDGHDHGDAAQHGAHDTAQGGHDHAQATHLPAGPDAPGVSVALTRDPMSGWNLHVSPQNFRFAPENASASDVPGEGHAHVYVNDVKLARLYSEWMHIPDLPKGPVEVKVSLNANSHSPLMVDGIPVEAVVTVQVE